MADIIIRIGTQRRRVKWPDDVEPVLAVAESVIRTEIARSQQYTVFTLNYIGGWAWQMLVDGRIVGSVVVITDVS